MKNIFKLIIAIVLLYSTFCYAGTDEFIITVKSDNTGPSTNKQFTIPTFGGGYDYNVDCNSDGTFEKIGAAGDYTCDFSVFAGAGTYQVSIIGNMAGFEGFPRIYFNNTGDRLKVLNIVQWGTNPWHSMIAAFRGASNMTVTATDVPDLSQVTETRLMFAAANMANPDTSMWDTSNITNMVAMFQNATSAAPDVSNWDVSNVSNMGFLFAGATNANPNLSQWVISNAGDMTNMLGGSGISTINYDAMLINFNLTTPTPPTNINLNNVPTTRCSQAAKSAYTNLILTYNWMINDLGICKDFVIEVDTTIAGATTNLQFLIKTTGTGYNYNVDCDYANAGTNTAIEQTGNYTCNYATSGVYTIHISDNVGDKTGFPRFYSSNHNDAKKITNLKQWGTGIWTSMSSAFRGAENMIVSAVDVPDLSQVTSLGYMFRGATLANPNTSGWNTSNVTTMYLMFYQATSANPDTSGWDTANVTAMYRMFNGATSANPDTSGWNTTNVIFMDSMFNGATSANPDTSGWDTANVTDMSFMFSGATSANPNVQSWDITNINSMSGMFSNVTLPTADYDAMLAHFNSQAVQSGITFSGGNSKYCNVAARESLTNVATGHGWTITDGGLDANCSDIIFDNSFEEVIVFKAAEKQFVYDFAEVSIKLDTEPLLIARGVDAHNNTVIKIYLRKDVGQLQIRKDTLEIDGEQQSQWAIGKWQNTDNNKLTQILWK